MTDNTLDMDLLRIVKAAKRNEASSLGHLSEHEAVDELKEIIADREKKMLEFVIGEDTPFLEIDTEEGDVFKNELRREQRQRAKEWRER